MLTGLPGEKGVLFVINSGDLVADSNDGRESTRFFNSTGLLRSCTTYIAVPGNHDQRDVLRMCLALAGPYSFDCGDTRILLLDSTDDAPENLTEQAKRVISSFGSFYGARIVILHHPLYSSDKKHYGGWENLQKSWFRSLMRQESGWYFPVTFMHSNWWTGMVSRILPKREGVHRHILLEISGSQVRSDHTRTPSDTPELR